MSGSLMEFLRTIFLYYDDLLKAHKFTEDLIETLENCITVNRSDYLEKHLVTMAVKIPDFSHLNGEFEFLQSIIRVTCTHSISQENALIVANKHLEELKSSMECINIRQLCLLVSSIQNDNQ